MSRALGCPKCGARPGEACRDTRSQEPMRTQHWDRLAKPAGRIPKHRADSRGLCIECERLAPCPDDPSAGASTRAVGS